MWLIRRHTALLLLLLFAPAGLVAQEGTKKADLLRFFEERAREDARNEHLLKHTHPEDERDYWADQRNFEKDLKKLSYKTYQAYLKEKRNAYADQSMQCDSSCSHSDYYYRMAAFYEHYGSRPYLDPKNAESESISAVQKKKLK
ncbi:hypothetical protein [Poritiphilus flavus]|uniref:Uncharacterized protein n=1 Tax=Poritiphilus flavus TaxID=2697053 RepID=A0A6L9E7V9_9FLAO|nr:hypothetical protein [Poritiphilus flavus]NAS10692.1 hypothetical protein [Poritiphilus flavus]